MLIVHLSSWSISLQLPGSSKNAIEKSNRATTFWCGLLLCTRFWSRVVGNIILHPATLSFTLSPFSSLPLGRSTRIYCLVGVRMWKYRGRREQQSVLWSISVSIYCKSSISLDFSLNLQKPICISVQIWIYPDFFWAWGKDLRSQFLNF